VTSGREHIPLAGCEIPEGTGNQIVALNVSPGNSRCTEKKRGLKLLGKLSRLLKLKEEPAKVQGDAVLPCRQPILCFPRNSDGPEGSTLPNDGAVFGYAA
jgi:hypothetical protein